MFARAIIKNKDLHPMFTRTTALTPSELKSAIVRDPLIVKPDTPLIEAIAQMSGVRAICDTTKENGQLDELHLEARSSCVLVAENDRLVGIVTERDVVRLSAQQRSLETLAVREVMAHPVITMYESALTDLLSTINMLQQYQIRHLPILNEDDRLVGLVTHESLRQTSRPVDLLRLRLVSEVMASQVICAKPDVLMLAIAQLMAKHRVSSVMIVETDTAASEPLQIPVGIVTERDIVQFQALGLNLETCLAQTVMSSPIFAVKPDESLWAVHQIMEQHLIHRLAVTGNRGELLGIITQTSLLQALNPLELYKLAEVMEQKVVVLEAEKIELLKSRTVELEQQVQARTTALKAKAEREKLVAAIAMQIRSSLRLQTILDTTAAQVRQVLGCDRVNIWQFEADWQTIAVAESTDSPLSLVNERINDICFQQQCMEIYRQGRIRVVPDIYTTEMSDCHREMLIRLHTRAKILVPLLCGDELWGLLNATESQNPRPWQLEEVELLQALSVQLGIAIQQATTHQKLQDQLSERQQAEARLLASEERYITLTAAAPVGIFRTDADGKCTYVNDRWCQIAGLTPESSAGDGWQQGLHPEDRDKIATEWYRAALENRPFSLEYRFQRADGVVTWVYGQSVAEHDASGQAIGYVGTITDISDRKRAELTLQKLVTGTAAVTGKDFFLALVRQISEALDIDCAIVTELVGDKLHTLGFWANGTLQPEKSYHPAKTPCESVLNDGEFYCESELQSIFPDAVYLATMQADSYLGIALKDDLGNAIGNLCILDMQPLPAEKRAEAIAILQVFAARAAAELQRKAANDALHRLNQDLEARVAQRTRQLQAREAQLRDLFDNATDLIQSIAPDGRILFVNAAWKETLGYNDADLLDLSLFQIIHPDELVHCQTAMQSLFAGALCLGIETRFITKDGREIVVEGNVNCQLQNGIPIATRGIFRNITQRKQTELRLQQQAEQQQLLGSVTKRMRSSLNLYEILNATVEELHQVLQSDRVLVYRVFPGGTGAAIAESVSPNWPKILNIVFPEEVFPEANYKRYLQGRIYTLSDRLDRNQSVLPCLVGFLAEIQVRAKLVVPIIKNKTLWGLLIAHQCDRPRQWQEREINLLQQTANQLAIAIQQASLVEQLQKELIERQQAETKLTDSNQQLAISNQELARATRLKDEFLANMSHELRTPLNAILGMTEGLQEGVFGTVNEKQLKALQTVERSGSHLLELIDDILDVAKIEAGQVELDCTAISVSHICQSSLAFIKQQALKKSIQLEVKIPPNLPDLLVDERRIRQVLINLLNNAVKFTNPEGRITVEVTRIRPITPELTVTAASGEVTHTTQNSSELTVTDSSVEVDRITQNIPELTVANSSIEVTQIPQSFSKLTVTNFSKEVTQIPQIFSELTVPDSSREVTQITQNNPELTVTESSPQNFLRIAVIDTGIGIAPENIKKLFQPFIQIDTALNRQYAGTGLGLALVKRIVELHGGKVELTSELGRGSCFAIELPCTADSTLSPEIITGDRAATPEPDSLATGEATNQKPSILLVEDNEANISTVSSYLGAKGYRIILAKDGQQAIEMAKTQQPSLILMDIQMSGMDGLEAIGQIRLDPDLVRIPIIALTALAMTGDRDRCLEAGANYYLTKPVKLKQLVTTIQQLLAETQDRE